MLRTRCEFCDHRLAKSRSVEYLLECRRCKPTPSYYSNRCWTWFTISTYSLKAIWDFDSDRFIVVHRVNMSEVDGKFINIDIEGITPNNALETIKKYLVLK